MKTYHILTLGCPKNSVDSEGMDGILAAAGYQAVDLPAAADVLIVNTCSFIAVARDETLQTLQQLGRRKAPGQVLVAAGCMAESHTALVRAVAGVDAVLSTRQWPQIGELVAHLTTNSAAAPRQRKPGEPLPVLTLQPTPNGAGDAPEAAPGYADWRSTQIRRTTSGPSAYLKISDGCNLRCAFCTIPSFKGDMRSKPMDAVLAEAQELVGRGSRELVLVAQHLTDYGRDLGMRDGLARLLDALAGVLPTDCWVRLMYAYPHGITPSLIETMARHPQICAYLDMPLQHAHPVTLRRMRRPADTEATKATIAALRRAMPDIALRSTFIVGFPGETEEEFRALLGFLAEVQFDRVGAFRYSQEPGTHAATLPNQVRARTIEARWHTLMQRQQTIALARNQRWQGRTIAMLVEGAGTAEDGQPLVVGRSFRDAPEIDGQVFAWGTAPVGQMVRVAVSQATAYDLWGHLAAPVLRACSGNAA